MISKEKSMLEYSLKEVSSVALSAFWNIMDQWGVESEDQISLIGIKTDLSVDDLKKAHTSSISRKMLERISFVLKIYKYLEILFPNREQSHAWIKKPNDVFGGETALMVILSDKENGLVTVAKYLNSQFQMPNAALDKKMQKEYILTLILEWVDSTEDALNW
jgi:antitoxin component HigA of HigAB toxin-antitoxin module